MRILKLRFLNLNALAGEWEIDFTGPEYMAEGIFAITGPTGAGKTTLLDAICLALYGRTPRLSRITRSTNEIMSRQTGECFAEVTYQTQRGQFRSHWGQHRARRRADGELQPARHEIVDMHTGKVLETGIMEVARKTESVTGMDFGRFTRSMLLAQGGFAAFLEASPDERAPILEQITGTDIYSRISMDVHERRALEQQQLATLQAGMQTTSLLDEDSLAHAHEALAQRSGQMALLGNHLQRLEEQRAWLRRLDTLEHEVDGLQEEAGVLENEWQKAAALRARYADATRAAALEPLHARLSTLRSQQQGDQAQLQLHDVEHQQFRQQTESFNEALAQAQRQHVQVQQTRSRALPVIRQARSLDQQVQRARQTLDHENERLAERVRARDQHRAELDKRILSRESQARQLTAARAYLDQHAHDAYLGKALAGVAMQRESLLAIRKKMSQITADIATAEAALKRARASLDAQKAARQENERSRDQMQAALARQAQALATLLNGQLLRELHNEKDGLLRERLLLKKIHDLHEERTHLQSGQPCPLCGATEHPFASHELPQADEMDVRIAHLETRIGQAHACQDRIEQCKADLEAAMTKVVASEQQMIMSRHHVEQAQSVLTNLQHDHRQLQEAAQEARKALSDLLAPFGVALPDDDMATLVVDELEKRAQQWQHSVDTENRLAGQQVVADQEISRLEKMLAQLDEQLGQAQQISTARQHELERLQHERQTCLDEPDVDALSQRLEQEEADARRRVENARQEKDQHEKRVVALATRKQALQQAMAERAHALQDIEQDFLKRLENAGFKDESAFLRCRLPDAERMSLQDQLDTMKTRRTQLAARLQDRRQRLQTAQEQALTQQTLDAIETAIASRRQQLSVLQEAAAGLTHRLQQHDLARQQLRKQQEALNLQQQVVDRWDALHQLVGSADGKKYRNFAQGLTFEWMVGHANTQLQTMTDRYVLVHDAFRPLELGVIDNYQAGERRSTRNLSGGESFIVSLALALGLSSMASTRMQVDSLFLDEGFGTLDEEALDMALDTLAKLQHEGKLIGVISHVSALKERISTQIRVVPIAGGRSRLQGPGCRQADSAKS